MKHKYKSHKSIRKLKNKKHQILCSLKGNIRRCYSRNKNTRKKNSLSESRREIYLENYNAKRIIMGDSKKGYEFHTQLLLEYSSLYPGKFLDIKKEIYNFSRNTLLRMVLVLGQNYGLCRISDMEKKRFFSYKSELIDEMMHKIYNYIKRNKTLPYNVSYASQKTFLEFLKLIFSIRPELCHDKYNSYMAEIKTFDLLLAINEQKVTPYQPNIKEKDDLARMMYVGLYATNEFTNNNETLDLSEQMYYALTFFEFISSNFECEVIYKTFLNHFSINDWREYFLTIVGLNLVAFKQGLGFLDVKLNDPDHIFNANVLQKISLNEDAYIESDDDNRDIVVFRSRPLISMNDGKYLVYNKQLLNKRLYNSIYFDLLSYNLKYRKKSFNQFYKDTFVEKYLFDHSILECLDGRNLDKCFPLLQDIKKEDFINTKEEENQPDFYFREGDSAFIFECKAIKLNGDLKVKASVDDIIDELENKLSVKRWSLKDGVKQAIEKEKPEGVGQLVNHIVRLENFDFKWDTIDPKSISFYYPVLVLENSEIAQVPLSAIANEWYQKGINQNLKTSKDKCKPLIVMTIKTFFFYYDLFQKNGFKFYFDKFINKHIYYKDNSSFYYMDEFNDFDTWMRMNYTSHRDLYYKKKFEEIIEWKKQHQANKGI